MPDKRSITAGIGIVACAGVLGACGGGATDTTGTSGGGTGSLDFTIGNVVPLTGDLADFGPSGRKAGDVAVEQIEAAIKETGADHKVEIQTEDEETTPQTAIQAARNITEAGAPCLVGGYASPSSLAIARSVTDRERILQITPASTSDEITALDDDGLVNRVVPPDSFQGPVLADLIEDQIGGAEGKVVNIGARNDAYGTGLAETFRAAWEERGGEIGEEVIYDPDQPTYSSEAEQLTAGDPDAYAIIDFPDNYGPRIGPALARTGSFDPSIAFATDGLASAALPEDAGPEATEGMRGTVPGAPEGGKASEAFEELWTSSDGPDRNTFDAQTFDAVVLCYLAAVAAGEADGEAMAAELAGITSAPGQKYTWEQLPEAIEALQAGEDIDYEGASGSIEMDEVGDATAGVYDIYAYTDGQLEVIDQVPLSSEEAEQ